jgi:hypothetical protein
MKAVTGLGMVFVLLGIIGVFAGSQIFKQHRIERGLGPLRLEHQETISIPIPPLLGGVVLIAGVGLMVIGSRQS